MLQKELGVLLTPPTGEKKAQDWKGLEIMRELQIKFEDPRRLGCTIDHITDDLWNLDTYIFA